VSGSDDGSSLASLSFSVSEGESDGCGTSVISLGTSISSSNAGDSGHVAAASGIRTGNSCVVSSNGNGNSSSARPSNHRRGLSKTQSLNPVAHDLTKPVAHSLQQHQHGTDSGSIRQDQRSRSRSRSKSRGRIVRGPLSPLPSAGE
jgi:hypothetical protein